MLPYAFTRCTQYEHYTEELMCAEWSSFFTHRNIIGYRNQVEMKNIKKDKKIYPTCNV